MKSWRMKPIVRCIVVAAVTVLLYGSVVTAAIDPKTSHIGNNYEPYTPAAVVKPSWSVVTDYHYLMRDGHAAAGEGKAYFLQNGQLIAVDVQSGKKSWKFGASLQGPLLYNGGRVYVGSTTGMIYAVNAATGKKVWAGSVPSKDAVQFVVNGDQLFAANGDLQAYGLKDGKFQWRDNYKNGGYFSAPLVFAGSRIVTTNAESHSYSVLHAFDRKTGKEAWRLGLRSSPLDVDGKYVVSQTLPSLMEFPHITLQKINVESGEVVKTVEYNPENMDPSKEEFRIRGTAWISGDRVYIALGSKVYGYPVDADPSEVTPDSYVPDGYRQLQMQMSFAAGPYDGRLIFTDNISLHGVKLVNRTSVSYNYGLTNPIARFDMIGHGIYIAQTDGRMVAINLLTAMPVVQLQTYGRVFGPTLLENGMIIVQTKGKLIAFKEPAGLKMK